MPVRRVLLAAEGVVSGPRVLASEDLTLPRALWASNLESGADLVARWVKYQPSEDYRGGQWLEVAEWRHGPDVDWGGDMVLDLEVDSVEEAQAKLDQITAEEVAS